MADGDEPIEPINVYNDLPAALQAHVLRQASDDSVLQMRCASRRDRDVADVVSAQRIPRLRAYATGLEDGTLTWDGLLGGIHNANPTQRGTKVRINAASAVMEIAFSQFSMYTMPNGDQKTQLRIRYLCNALGACAHLLCTMIDFDTIATMGNARLSQYHTSTMQTLRQCWPDERDFNNRRPFVLSHIPAPTTTQEVDKFLRHPVFWVSPRGLVVISGIHELSQNRYGRAYYQDFPLAAIYFREVSFDTGVTLDETWNSDSFADWVSLWRDRAKTIGTTLKYDNPSQPWRTNDYAGCVRGMCEALDIVARTEVYTVRSGFVDLALL